MNLVTAAGVAFGLAVGGFAAGWLTGGGVLAAGVIGTAVFTGAGLPGALVLALFFASGSVLSAGNARRYQDPKGARRNPRQVLANGTWAAVGALLVQKDPLQGWAVLAGSLSAAQSDTWATEIGRRARVLPRLVTTWQPVPAGTSGGVSLLGTAGGVLGALTLSTLAWVAGAPLLAAAWGLVGGVIGMLADSLVGATAQARFHCDSCGAPTEQPVHHCEQATRLVRGVRWLDNDMVNFLACLTGAGVAVLGTSLR